VTAAEGATLLDGLQREAALYRSLIDVSGEELRLVKGAELEQATVLLAKKQQVLEEIGAIEKTVKPLKERWSAIRATLPGETQSKFSSVLKDLSDLLEKLIATERETEEVLSGQIALVKKTRPLPGAEERAKKAYGGK
jgi:hypothetical protein